MTVEVEVRSQKTYGVESIRAISQCQNDNEYETTNTNSKRPRKVEKDKKWHLSLDDVFV